MTRVLPDLRARLAPRARLVLPVEHRALRARRAPLALEALVVPEVRQVLPVLPDPQAKRLHRRRGAGWPSWPSQ